jgi:hypothetical protein
VKYNLFYRFFFTIFIVIEINAQSVDIESRWLTDEIPARTNQQSLSLILPVSETWKIRSSYQYHFTDQEEFAGLPRIRTALHSFQSIFELNLSQWRLSLAAGGKINIYTDNKSAMGDYYFGIRYTLPLIYSFEIPTVVMTLYGEASRNRETSVATAIKEQISSEDFSGSIEVDIQKMFTIIGKFTKQYYSDKNEKINAYGVVLYHPFTNPWVAVGYAYAYANSLFDHWTFTNSTRVTFDPRTGQATYEYSYFYKPYFTPMKERGHLALGIIQWSIIQHLAIYGKATVPFSSKGLQKYSPSTGYMPAPFDYDVYYELDGILPTQYEASIISDILDPVIFRLNAEYFKKPYYSYYAFGINIGISF